MGEGVGCDRRREQVYLATGMRPRKRSCVGSEPDRYRAGEACSHGTRYSERGNLRKNLWFSGNWPFFFFLRDGLHILVGEGGSLGVVRVEEGIGAQLELWEFFLPRDENGRDIGNTSAKRTVSGQDRGGGGGEGGRGGGRWR